MPLNAQPEPIAPKPKRRWLQVGLRTLFAFVTVAAIGLGFWVNPAERQKRAVAAVKSLGGSVSYDEWLRISDPAPERAWYRKLLGDDYFSSVVHVYLSTTQVTDAELAHLKGLTGLKYLVLNGAQVTDVGLEHLKGLTQLEALNLYDTQVTDAGLVRLKGLTRLEWLNLYRTQVTDAGMVHLKGLTRLKWLVLRRTQVTGAGIAELQKALPECDISGP